jgi:hypothetical protein
MLLPLALLVACATKPPHMSKLKLDGAQEVPAVMTTAKGTGEITVLPDQSVSGKVTYSGFEATAAHIHMGAPNKNGPVILPLAKAGTDTFVVPGGMKLNKTQYEAYKAGNLYVNIHSAKNKGGEIRAQIVPPAPPK